MNQFDRNNLVRQRAWIDQQLAQDDAMRQRQPPYAYQPMIAPSFQPPPSAVTSGTAQSVATTNQTFHDTWNMISDKYSELARDIATVNVGQANILAKQNECCCSILRSIDGVNYNNAINTATIQKTIMEDGQKTRDLITANKIEALQNEVNQLKLAQQMQGVVRYPNVMAYNAGTSPFCNNNGCGGC